MFRFRFTSCFGLAALVLLHGSDTRADERTLVRSTLLEAQKALRNQTLCRICPCTIETRTTVVSLPPPLVPPRPLNPPKTPETPEPLGLSGQRRKVTVVLVEDRSTSFTGSKLETITFRLHQIARWSNLVRRGLHGMPLVEIRTEPKAFPFDIKSANKLAESSSSRYSPIARTVRSVLRDVPVGEARVAVVITDGSESPLTEQDHCNENRARLDATIHNIEKGGLVFFGIGGAALPETCLVTHAPPAPLTCPDETQCGLRPLPPEGAPDEDAAFQSALRTFVDAAGREPQKNDPAAGQVPNKDTGATAAISEYVLHQRVPTTNFDDAVLLGDDTKWDCSGVVVSPQAVLTAAHCLPITRVYVGQDEREQGVVHHVAEAVRHPDGNLDLALLRIEGQFGVRIKLRRGASDDQPPVGILRYTGFGATDTSGVGGFGRKKILDLPASGWGCDGNRVESTGCRSGLELVLPGSAGRDTCSGDSGGPVYELIASRDQCDFRLVAITSRRVADANVQCGSGGIYTRVDVADAWISRWIEQWRGGRAAPEQRRDEDKN